MIIIYYQIRWTLCLGAWNRFKTQILKNDANFSFEDSIDTNMVISTSPNQNASSYSLPVQKVSYENSNSHPNRSKTVPYYLKDYELGSDFD